MNAAKRCLQCDGCQASACQLCSACSKKQACFRNLCTQEKTGCTEIEDASKSLDILSRDLKDSTDDALRIVFLQKLIELDVSFSNLQNDSALVISKEARTLQGSDGKVGILAKNLLLKWKELGWSEWKMFMHNSDDSDEDTCINAKGNKSCVSDVEDNIIGMDEGTCLEQKKNDVQGDSKQDEGTCVEQNKISSDSSESDKSKGNSNTRGVHTSSGKNKNENAQKSGRAKLNEQKRDLDKKYEKLITKRPLDNKYECNCGYLCNTKAQASRHADKCEKTNKQKQSTPSAKNKNIKCNICEFSATTQNEMLEHRRRNHDVPDLYKCRYPNCKSVVKTIKHLTEHMKTHQRDKMPCPCCDKKYVQASGRNRHIFEKHKNALEEIGLEDNAVLDDLRLLEMMEATGDINEKAKRKAMNRLVNCLLQSTDKGLVDNANDNFSDVSSEDDSDENDDNSSDKESVTGAIKEEMNKDDSKNKERINTKEKLGEVDENNLSACQALRQRNIAQKKELYLSLGFGEFKEPNGNPIRKKTAAIPKLTLPTRRSKRLNGLSEDNGKELNIPKVLAPELCDFIIGANPIPVRQLRDLPKYMRTKAMPMITIPNESTQPPLPIRFYSCTPLLPNTNQHCLTPLSSQRRHVNESKSEYFQAVKPFIRKQQFKVPYRTSSQSDASFPASPFDVSSHLAVSQSNSVSPGSRLDLSQVDEVSPFQTSLWKPNSPAWNKVQVKQDQATMIDDGQLLSSSTDELEDVLGEGLYEQVSKEENCEPSLLLAMSGLTLKKQYFSIERKATGNLLTSRCVQNVEINSSGGGSNEDNCEKFLFKKPVVVKSGLCFEDDVDISDEEYVSKKKYICPVCPFDTAIDNKDLRRHIDKLHKEKSEDLVCPKFWCEDRFKTRYEYNQHTAYCKEIKCQEAGCSFKLKWKHQVSPHKRWHKNKLAKQ